MLSQKDWNKFPSVSHIQMEFTAWISNTESYIKHKWLCTAYTNVWHWNYAIFVCHISMCVCVWTSHTHSNKTIYKMSFQGLSTKRTISRANGESKDKRMKTDLFSSQKKKEMKFFLTFIDWIRNIVMKIHVFSSRTEGKYIAFGLP